MPMQIDLNIYLAKTGGRIDEVSTLSESSSYTLYFGFAKRNCQAGDG
jgi:hypothetical protein